AMQVIDVRGLTTPTVGISIGFEANYTEFTPREGNPRGEMSYYVRERWELERKRDVLSPAPDQATALHCPRCGAPLQKDTVGACAAARNGQHFPDASLLDRSLPASGAAQRARPISNHRDADDENQRRRLLSRNTPAYLRPGL